VTLELAGRPEDSICCPKTTVQIPVLGQSPVRYHTAQAQSRASSGAPFRSSVSQAPAFFLSPFRMLLDRWRDAAGYLVRDQVSRAPPGRANLRRAHVPSPDVHGSRTAPKRGRS
jgi:hypothetical protein